MVSYEPLWKTMEKRGMTTYALIFNYNIPSKTIYNLKHNQNITPATIEKLCNILICTPNDIIRFDKGYITRSLYVKRKMFREYITRR